MGDKAQSTGAVAGAVGGLAAAFAAAACCGLPVMLASVGVAASYRIALTCVALAAIVFSLVLALRASRVCTPGVLCARPGFRVGIIAAAIVAAALLVIAWP